MNNHETHFIGKVAQKAIIVHKGRVLLLKNAQDPENAPWELPGGRLNEGEEPAEGLQRELREELSIEISVGRVVAVSRFFLKRTGEMHLLIIYEASFEDLETPIELNSGEVLEYRFVPLSELRNITLYDQYRDALNTYLEQG